MLIIEYKDSLEEELCEIIDKEFNKFALLNGVDCNYTPFNFVAKENNNIVRNNNGAFVL